MSRVVVDVLRTVYPEGIPSDGYETAIDIIRLVEQADEIRRRRDARFTELLAGPIVACGAEHVSGHGARCDRPLGHEGDHDFGEDFIDGAPRARWPGRKVPREEPSATYLTLAEQP